ncbi:hypothetical protein SLS54_007594 [Diplodia seriata]
MPRGRSISFGSVFSSTGLELDSTEYANELTHQQAINLPHRTITSDDLLVLESDEEDAEQRDDSLNPDSRDLNSEQESDSGSEAGWQPPDPRDETYTEEGAQRLLTFQRLPGEAQVRVIYLHQVEGVPIPQAIDEVATEQRLQLQESPIQARQTHTVALRLMLEQVNENLFNQWLLLTVLIQSLPPQQQETGRRVLRLVSDDPRNFKNVYQAARAAADLNNPYINRVLRDIQDNATSFNRNSEDLQGLNRYDRHQAPLDPEPVDGPPHGMPTADDLINNERQLFRGTSAMRLALKEYQKVYSEFMEAMFMSLTNYSDDPTIRGLLPFVSDWFEDELSDKDAIQKVLDCGSRSPAWDDPETCDAPSMLLGAFFKCTLGTNDRPSFALLYKIADWENWQIGSPGTLANQAMEKLVEMEDNLIQFFNASRLLLVQEIKDLGRSGARAERARLLRELENGHDSQQFNNLRREMLSDMRTWPLAVQDRAFVVGMMWEAKESLAKLRRATSCLSQGLEDLGGFLSKPVDSMRPVFHLYNRAMRRNHLVGDLSVFSKYHHQAVREFRALVDQSCRHPRAKTLILAGIPASGYGADLERARDVATAANVQKPILDSADMLLAQQRRIVDVSMRIRMHERSHLKYLRNLHIVDITTILTFSATRRSQLVAISDLSGRLPAHSLEHHYGRPDFGSVLAPLLDANASDHQSDVDYGALEALSAAALQKPLEDTLSLLHLHSEADSVGTVISSSDARLLANLHVRFLYLTHAELAPRDSLSAARLLSRHCWHFGLHGAWMAWAASARRLLNTLLDSLPQPYGSDVRSLVDAIEQPDRDYVEIEKELASENSGCVEMALKEEFFELAERLRVLRAATSHYLNREDRVDPAVLPPWEGLAVCDVKPRGEDREQEAVEWLHGMVSFDRSVLDGGKAVVKSENWKEHHNDWLRRWGLGHLVLPLVDGDAGFAEFAPVVYRY